MDLQQMLEAVLAAEPYKMILSNPYRKDEQFRRIVINRLETCWQAEKYTEKQVFHENMSEETLKLFLEGAMGQGYRQLNAWDGEREHAVRVSKGGKASYMKKKTAQAPKEKTGHNRKKNYILEEGQTIPPLVDMGIFTSEGKIVRSMYDKYRQINRFVELIDDEIGTLPKDRTLTVIDFGCGKSYLTFILYYYLTQIRKLDVRIIGLDLKADVIEHCNRAAEKYGYENLRFELGDINGYECPYPVDMVVSLHACDTATDYALYNAVRWNARLIFSVPCCQHELNGQMQGGSLPILTRYGIIKERTAALMTDAIRGNLLTKHPDPRRALEYPGENTAGDAAGGGCAEGAVRVPADAGQAAERRRCLTESGAFPYQFLNPSDCRLRSPVLLVGRQFQQTGAEDFRFRTGAGFFGGAEPAVQMPGVGHIPVIIIFIFIQVVEIQLFVQVCVLSFAGQFQQAGVPAALVVISDIFHNRRKEKRKHEIVHTKQEKDNQPFDEKAAVMRIILLIHGSPPLLDVLLPVP